MSDIPTEFSTVSDGEPSIPKAAACSSEGVRHCNRDKQLEPSIIIDDEPAGLHPEAWEAIARDIEQRRERIARRLEP